MRTVCLLAALAALPAARGDDRVSFRQEETRLRIDVAGKPFAEYVFADEKVLRPYFTRLHAPNGVQVTRNHPPVAGKDPTDHDTMHPGLWLAFGEMGGGDFWRNKGRVRHVVFVEKPAAGRFAVRNRYLAGERVVCEEVARFSLRVRPHGYLLLWDSEFRSEAGFAFGDQEEMGLGVRVATPLSVKKGGRIVNANGEVNQKQAWGKQADWCDYSGKGAGVVLMPHPGNFRRCWFHARDYGLLVANPFGKKAFTRGEPSRVEVKKGETFRLRFGVLVHTGKADGKSALADYRKLAGE